MFVFFVKTLFQIAVQKNSLAGARSVSPSPLGLRPAGENGSLCISKFISRAVSVLFGSAFRNCFASLATACASSIDTLFRMSFQHIAKWGLVRARLSLERRHARGNGSCFSKFILRARSTFRISRLGNCAADVRTERFTSRSWKLCFQSASKHIACREARSASRSS